jgi:hypothetical protein
MRERYSIQSIVEKIDQLANTGTQYVLYAYLYIAGGRFSMLWLTRLFAGIMVLMLVSSTHARLGGRELDWRTFEVPAFGTSIQYPADIFTSVGNAEKGIGERFESADGRAVLSIYSLSQRGRRDTDKLLER